MTHLLIFSCSPHTSVSAQAAFILLLTKTLNSSLPSIALLTFKEAAVCLLVLAQPGVLKVCLGWPKQNLK